VTSEQLQLRRLIQDAARVIGNEAFTPAYVLEECAARRIIERGGDLESLTPLECEQVHEWVVGAADIEACRDQFGLFSYVSQWMAQARMRMDRDAHGAALAALDLAELAITRLSSISKQRMDE
jgi:hypothetical protein